jgi:hypothetical protein
MRTLPISSSIFVYWQNLVFLEAALLADEETKVLAAIVTPVLDEFSTTLQKDLDTRRAVVQASARAFVADADIDQGIRGLFSDVLSLVGQNRKRPEFTTLFPSHIGDIIRHALRKQIDVAADIADKLALKIYPDNLRATHTKALNTLVKRGKAVLDEVRKAENARVEGRIDLRTWKEEANAARLTIYGQLLAMAAKSGRGKAWAEGFFPRTSGSSDDAEDIADAPEPAAPDPAEKAGGEAKPS